MSALSPETWFFSLELLPQPAYLVGGAVRDTLLGRCAEYLDLDFVLPTHAVETARKVAATYQAGFVLLDAKRQIARVVFPQGTVDFAQQEGSSLETDLNRRDFRLNAIAYNPHTQKLIDPLNGYEDLQQGIIRMISPTNLQNDPLRLLRAYRQAAQLGFIIESETQSIIRELAPLLGTVPAERVLAELRYLLRTPKGTPWLVAAGKDGLLLPWFPDADVSKLIAVDSAAELVGERWHQLEVELVRSLKDTINTSLLGIAKLAYLLPNNPQAAEEQMLRLNYSNVEIRTVITCIKHLRQLQAIATSPTSLSEQYFFFQNSGIAFPALVVLAVVSGIPIEALTHLINRYLDPEDLVAHPTPLVSGNDLIKALQIRPSPKIGKLLTAIQLARIEGKIATAQEALKFAAQQLDSP